MKKKLSIVLALLTDLQRLKSIAQAVLLFP